MPSDNGIPKHDYGQDLTDQYRGKNPTGGSSGPVSGGGSSAVETSSGYSSGGGSSYGGSGGSGGSGGGSGLDDPTEDEVRSIFRMGMREMLGRDASADESKAFFKKFLEFSKAADNNLSADQRQLFVEDWFNSPEQPGLQMQYTQHKVATDYLGALDDVMAQIGKL